MNLLIFLPSERDKNNCVTINGERAHELVERHALVEGIEIRCGELNGSLGRARIDKISEEQVILNVKLSEAPPERTGIRLVVGLSRPQTTKKVLQLASVHGCDSLDFVHTGLGQKSYLQSKTLREEDVQAELIKGLEQACDTVAPIVRVHKTFDHFMREVVPGLLRDERGAALALVGDSAGKPLGVEHAPSVRGRMVLLAVGPEAGWEPRELEAFSHAGFIRTTLGPRLLRVEHAVSSLVSQVELLRTISTERSLLE